MDYRSLSSNRHLIKNRNSATEITENTERFKELGQHAALTRWMSIKQHTFLIFLCVLCVLKGYSDVLRT